MTATMSSNLESQSSELPRKPTPKTSEHRRATKPIMEKKRRARINNSLNELKVLILDALNKDPSRHSKLEKADILEMTVKHLQNIQRQQMATAISADPTVLNKYRAGFHECATEVHRYVNRVDGVDTGLRSRIIGHLESCVSSLDTATNMASNTAYASRNGAAFPGMIPPRNSAFGSANTPLHVQIPMPAATAAAIAAGMFPSSGLSGANSGDINNNISSPIINSNQSLSSMDGKPSVVTPPSSASSTASSHFTFSLPMHQLSPPISNAHQNLLSFHHNLNQNLSNQMPSNLSSTHMIFRQGSGSWSRNTCLESPMGQSSMSPCSVGSEQLSPSETSDVEMVAEPRLHQNSGDSVWRPW